MVRSVKTAIVYENTPIAVLFLRNHPGTTEYIRPRLFRARVFLIHIPTRRHRGTGFVLFRNVRYQSIARQHERRNTRRIRQCRPSNLCGFNNARVSSSPSTSSKIRPGYDSVFCLSGETALPISSILSFTVWVLLLRGLV
jgi:hypothetical protein